MELLLPDVDPHVLRTNHHVRIPRQPEPGDVERQREGLIGHGHVDMLHPQDVPDVLSSTIVCCVVHLSLLVFRSQPHPAAGKQRYGLWYLTEVPFKNNYYERLCILQGTAMGRPALGFPPGVRHSLRHVKNRAKMAVLSGNKFTLEPRTLGVGRNLRGLA